MQNTAPTSGLSVLALLALACTALGQGGPPVFTVYTDTAHQKDVSRSLEFVGSLEPWRVIDLSSQVADLVRDIPINEGQLLAEGDVICQLDTLAVEIDIQRLQAELARSRADLARLQSGYRTQEIEESRRQLEEARARLSSARDEWERNQALIDKGVISQREANRSESLFREGQAAVARAQANLDMLTTGYRKEEVDAAQADVDKQVALLREAERRLERHTIRAGMDCAVVERLKEPGEWVRIGEPVARLVVLDPLKVRIDVPQRHLADIVPGAPAVIEIDGLPDQRFNAQVDHIVPRAGNSTRNFPVMMRLDNPDSVLRSGLFARVQLQLGQPEPTVMVPREAIQIRVDRLVVLVAAPLDAVDAPSEGPAQGPPPANAVVREVDVRVGTELGELIAVEALHDGRIEAGEAVIVMGGSRLADGMSVRVIPDPSRLNAQTTVAGEPLPRPDAPY